MKPAKFYQEKMLTPKYRPRDRKSKNDKARLRFIPEGEHRRILDAGCGDGGFSKEIKDLTGTKVYGTDISFRGCELAAQKGITTKQADLNKEIPFEDNFFDLVYSGEVIEHLYDPDEFLKEVNRVLRPNGLLIITTPNLAAWYNRILILLGVQPLFYEASTTDRTLGLKFLKAFVKDTQPIGHIKIFTLSAMKDLLKMYGFKIEKIRGLSFPLFPKPILFLDELFSFCPSLSSNLMIRAKKLCPVEKSQKY